MLKMSELLVDEVCSQTQECLLLHSLATRTVVLRLCSLQSKQALRQVPRIDKRKNMQE